MEKIYGSHPATRTICYKCSREKTGVILTLKQYQQLQEDLHDLIIIAALRDELPVTLEEMKRRLLSHGKV
jgi:hypothetical protein